MAIKNLIIITFIATFFTAASAKALAEDTLNLAATKVQPLDSETPVSLKEKWTGKILLLDFWASWCGPCKESLPFYEDLEKRFGKDGLQVIAVSVDENKKSASDFLVKNKFQLNFFWDKNKEVAKNLGLKAVPTSLLIDRDGKILHRERGFFDSSKNLYEKKIIEYLTLPQSSNSSTTVR